MPYFSGDPLGRPELVGHVPGELLGTGSSRPVEGVGPEAHPAHGLDPAGDADVDGVGADQVGHEVVGLLGRAALAVDGGGRHLVGKALAQPRGAGHVGGLLPRLGHATSHDLLDVAGVDPGPLDQFDLGIAEELGGVEPGHPSVPLPDRSTHCFDDHWLGHGRSPLEVSSSKLRLAWRCGVRQTALAPAAPLGPQGAYAPGGSIELVLVGTTGVGPPRPVRGSRSASTDQAASGWAGSRPSALHRGLLPCAHGKAPWTPVHRGDDAVPGESEQTGVGHVRATL